MKKFLSLVLALVMVMSLTVISAGADDFTDYGDITYDEAVDVITALDIMDGYGETFGPSGGLSRGAAAKIICNLILSPTTASALVADTAPYPDVPANHDFAGYIAYCKNQGIISGYSDGTFKPTAPLSNYAFMKMLLGALGYDANVEQYVGPNWSVNVAKQALGIGLAEGLEGELNGTAPATREQAALYAFNTLDAVMVDYSETTTINTGDAEVNITGRRFEETWPQNTEPGTIDPDGFVEFAERYFEKLTLTGNGVDEFGRPSREWKWKSVIVGEYTDYTDLILEYTAKAPQGELYSAIGASIYDKLGDGEWVNGNWCFELSVYVDGLERDVSKTSYFMKNSSGAAGVKLDGTSNYGVSGNGVLTQVFMDDDNNVTIAMINTWLAKASADYNENTEILNVELVDGATNPAAPITDTSIENDDVYVADFVEGDYVLLTYSYDTNEVESAVKAELLTGEVSQFTYDSNVYLDGEKKSYVRLAGEDVTKTMYAVGEDAVVVLDEYGYIIFVDQAVSSSNFVFVDDLVSDDQSKKAVFNAYFTDGTYEEITLKKLDGDDASATLKGASDKWYTFSTDEAGKYSLNTVKNPLNYYDWNVVCDGSSNALVSVNGQVILPGTDVKADNSTIMVVLEWDDDVNAYEGVANLPDIELLSAGTAKVYSVVGSNNYADYIFVDLTGFAKGGYDLDDANVAADYLFLLKTTGNTTYVADDEYYEWKVLYDGEETTKYISELLSVNDPGELYYDVKENAKGYITDGDAFDEDDDRDVITLDGSKVKHSKGTITIGGKAYVVGDGCKVYLDIHKDAKLLLKDKGADYELHSGTAAAMAGVISNYLVDGTAYVALADDNVMIADAIYIFVDGAVIDEDGGGGGGTDADGDGLTSDVDPDDTNPDVDGDGYLDGEDPEPENPDVPAAPPAGDYTVTFTTTNYGVEADPATAIMTVNGTDLAVADYTNGGGTKRSFTVNAGDEIAIFHADFITAGEVYVDAAQTIIGVIDDYNVLTFTMPEADLTLRAAATIDNNNAPQETSIIDTGVINLLGDYAKYVTGAHILTATDIGSTGAWYDNAAGQFGVLSTSAGSLYLEVTMPEGTAADTGAGAFSYTAAVSKAGGFSANADQASLTLAAHPNKTNAYYVIVAQASVGFTSDDTVNLTIADPSGATSYDYTIKNETGLVLDIHADTDPDAGKDVFASDTADDLEIRVSGLAANIKTIALTYKVEGLAADESTTYAGTKNDDGTYTIRDMAVTTGAIAKTTLVSSALAAGDVTLTLVKVDVLTKNPAVTYTSDGFVLADDTDTEHSYVAGSNFDFIVDGDKVPSAATVSVKYSINGVEYTSTDSTTQATAGVTVVESDGDIKVTTPDIGDKTGDVEVKVLEVVALTYTVKMTGQATTLNDLTVANTDLTVSATSGKLTGSDLGAKLKSALSGAATAAGTYTVTITGATFGDGTSTFTAAGTASMTATDVGDAIIAAIGANNLTVTGALKVIITFA